MKYNARTRGARGECHTPVLYNGPSWNRSSFDYFFISPLPLSIQYLYAQLIFFKRQEKEKKQSSLRGGKKTVPRVAKFANQTVEEKIVISMHPISDRNPDLFRVEQS